MTRPILFFASLTFALLAGASAAAALPDTQEYYDRFGDAVAVGDFNQDGLDDLAIGVPGEDLGSIADAGIVHVLYGAYSSGVGSLGSTGNQLWSEDTAGVPDYAEAYDAFGQSLAAGDFDHDGYDDLAIGAPGEGVGLDHAYAGQVTILYGSSSGLTTVKSQLLSQDTTYAADQTEAGDRFGWALATGDLDGDGYDDLAVGVPYEDVGAITDCGAVNLFYGSWYQLAPRPPDVLWWQDQTNVEGVAASGDLFGYALAAGDFDHDGHDDLAVGVPFEDYGTTAISNAGAVNVLYGTPAGITAANDQIFTQSTIGVPGTVEANDDFGFALAAGRLNNDSYEDLAIGVPQDLAGAVKGGGVNVLFGSATRLSGTGSQLVCQGCGSIAGVPAAGEFFGASLGVGNLNGDAVDDLLVGVPWDAPGGGVHVLWGGQSALTLTGQYWSQDSALILDSAEATDQFGAHVAGGNFTGDGTDDLVVGVPGETLSGPTAAGAVQVIYTSSWIGTNQLWFQGP